MPCYGYGMGGWGMVWMLLSGLLVVGVLIAAVIAIVLAVTHRGVMPHRSSSVEVLAQRYARGEIDDEEYQRRLRLLSGSR